MSESFVESHRPKKLSDIRGHPTAIKKIKKWAKNWTEGDKALLLHGPAGTGKTSTAEALANDMEWEIEEVNASSVRRKDDIKHLVQSIRGKSDEPILFLIDECDSMDGRSLTPLKKILDDPPNPIIFTANEKWQVPNSIENNTTNHKFNLQKRSIKPVIRDIAEKEGIDISKQEIGKLATRQGLRDAINDLQEYAESDGSVDWDDREQDIGNFKAVDNILRGKKYSGEMTPPDLVDWLDENIYEDMDGVEAMRAFQCLSEADKFVQRANDTQNYSWWKYAGSIAEEVANVRLTEPYDWINKSYPKSRRNKPPKSTYDNPEATLYREIKNSEGYSGSFSFQEFRKDILPILKEQSKDERMNMVLSYSLSSDAMKGLDITRTQYENWLSEEKEIEESQTEIDQFEEETETESEEKGIFDF